MRRTLTYLLFLTFGILIGVGLVAFFGSSGGRSVLGLGIAALSGLGVGAACVAVLSRLWVTAQTEKWTEERSKALFADAVSAAENPQKLPQLIKDNQSTLTELGRLGVGMFMTNRALAYVAMALGAVVSVATLLTAYVQIERMEQQNTLVETQNRLIEQQNALTEASRRASLNFELSNILERFDDKRGLDDILVARISALTRSLRPYSLLEDGQLSKPVSPERGQLLTTLAAANVELHRVIEAGATFAAADLRGTNISLYGQWSSQSRDIGTEWDFSGADLRNAKFQLRKIEQVDLTDADMTGAKITLNDIDVAFLIGARLPAVLQMRVNDWKSLEIENALVPETGWLGDLFDRMTRRHRRMSSKAAVMSPPSDQFALLPVRRIRDTGPGPVRWRELPRADLSWFLQYKEVGGPETKIVVRDRMIEYQNLRISSSSNSDRMITANRAGIDAYLTSSSAFKIANRFEVFGDPNKAGFFLTFAERGLQLPSGADLRGISPNPNHAGAIKISEGISGPLTFKLVDFSYADLRRVDFAANDLGGAIFAHTLMPPWSHVKDANIEAAVLNFASVPLDWSENAIRSMGLRPKRICARIASNENRCFLQLFPTPQD